MHQGKIFPQISSRLTKLDTLGTWKVRFDIGRMSYTVDPGVYALGQPTIHSPILVTANYKLTFDALRSAIPDLTAWILVLDTDGINVWCAAGKGTFGTANLFKHIEQYQIAELVSHRELILPQLGAPGICAHEIQKISGFRVIYGPILARDIPAFMAQGKKATPAMRIKTFHWQERMVLVPIETVHGMTRMFWLLMLMFFLSLLLHYHNMQLGLMIGLKCMATLLSAFFVAVTLTPLLLPYIPGRALTIKGWNIGMLWVCILGIIQYHNMPFTWLEFGGLASIGLAITGFCAMEFTGATTYTSLSGVKKEMRWAVPMQLMLLILGWISWCASNIGYVVS